jgi:hypothetical protein
MGQAKQRQAEIAELKNPLAGIKPFTDTNSVKIYQVKSLDKFKQITGRLPYEFEQMEYLGPQISDQMVGGDSQKELYIGSWTDMIVEVTGRKGKGSKEYFAIRLNTDDVLVSRIAYHDTLTLTGIEAAFARFVLSVNSIGWYAASPANKGVVRLGPLAYIKGQDAADYYHMAMYAADKLGMTNVFRYLD